MKISLLTLICIFYSSTNAQTPNLTFAKAIGGFGADNSYGICVDLNQNIFVAGDFETSTDFDPGIATANITSQGMEDLFFAKYNAQGDYLWVKTIGSSKRESCSAIGTDASGNIYITGYFEGIADFDPGPGTATLAPLGTGRDFYFAKYDPNGNYLWAKSLNGGSTDIGNNLYIDAQSNVYLTGYFGTPLLDFDPGPGTSTLSAGIFFAKYDTNGNYVLGKSISSNGLNSGNSIKVDNAGNIYIAGYFGGIGDFDTGIGTATLNGGTQSTFFAKYDNFGNYVWAKNLGTTYGNSGSELEIDAGLNVYITGVFTGTIDFNLGIGTNTLASAGFGDIFLAKYDSNGDYVWAENFGGVGWEWGYTIDLDANSDIYISGSITGASVDFDPGSNTAFLNGSPNGTAIFLAKYSNSGGLMWLGGAGNIDFNEGYDLIVDGSGNLYLTGVFSSTQDFDFSSSTTTITAHGVDIDAFFAKYTSTAILGIESQEIYNGYFPHYPSPSGGTITFCFKDEKHYSFILYNNLGEEKKRGVLTKSNNSLNIADYTSGTYFITFTAENFRHTKKILVVQN